MSTSLMTARRFAPLFWCQFFSAFGDNFLKTVLVFLILFHIAGGNAEALITLAGATLIAPFFFLSGIGGEQQMLAVGRALVLNPRVLLLDEPLEGLAPIIVDELLKALRRIIRDEGMSAILVEQNAKKILGVTDHAVIVERGAVVHAADSATLLNDRAALETHLGVTDTGPRRFGRARH